MQKLFKTGSEIWPLRSPRSIMLSYWLMYVSKPLLKQCRCLDISFYLDHMSNRITIPFLILISMNKHSVLSCNLYSVGKQEAISSLIYRVVSLHHLRNCLACKTQRIHLVKIELREMTHQFLSQISVICLGAYKPQIQ